LEKKSGSGLMATPGGRRQTAVAKLLAAAVIGLCVSVLFTVVNRLFIGFKDGLYGAGGSALTISALSYSPLTLSIAQAALMFALFRVVGVMFISWICAAISYFVKEQLPSFICGAGFVGLSYGYYLLVGQNTNFPVWLRVLPDITMLSRPQWFFETYHVANIMNYPVFWSTLHIWFWLLISAALTGFIVWQSGRKVYI
jgi:hypothetical protein